MLSDAEERLTIGELARRAGVSTRTVRYYEEIGILPPPLRTQAGTRSYPTSWTFYLEGALMLKELGFTLDEIRTVGQLAFGEVQAGDLPRPGPPARRQQAGRAGEPASTHGGDPHTHRRS